MGIVPRNGVIVVGIIPAEACAGFVFMWDDVVEEWNGKTNCETKPTIPVQKHSMSCGIGLSARDHAYETEYLSLTRNGLDRGSRRS